VVEPITEKDAMTDVHMNSPAIDEVSTPPMHGLLKTLSRIPDYARLVFGLMWDSRVSLLDRVLVGASVVYLVSPLDILPDVFPVLGQIDDLFFLVFSLTRLFERTRRDVVLSHWRGRPEELTARALKRLVFLASFFAAPRMRRRLRSLGKGAES
jgi:uncharacterized membrane protein YkvA (DUF1232 family)